MILAREGAKIDIYRQREISADVFVSATRAPSRADMAPDLATERTSRDAEMAAQEAPLQGLTRQIEAQRSASASLRASPDGPAQRSMPMFAKPPRLPFPYCARAPPMAIEDACAHDNCRPQPPRL